MAAKACPIVFVASGTTASTAATYRQMEEVLAAPFPAHPCHWAYSSRGVGRRLKTRNAHWAQTPADVLRALAQQGYRCAVMQSLHLICGVEFHALAQAASGSGLAVRIGMPLLSQPDDFAVVEEWIANTLPSAPDAALVLVGHGTTHPSWTAYAFMAQCMAARFGSRVQLGLLKNGPTAEMIAGRILAAGMSEVILRPFMVVAGRHFKHDVAGSHGESWATRLQRSGLRVSVDEQAMGTQAAVAGLFGRHLAAAVALV